MTDHTPEKLDALVAALRMIGDRSSYAPHMHHVAADAITDLRAQLAETDALIAAAYEAAAVACDGEYLEGETHEETDIAYDHAVADCLSAIRALTPSTAREAYSAAIAAAERAGYERGMREDGK